WGIATQPEVSAIAKAETPFVDGLYNRYAHSKLDASGMAVGLPDGQMGNSEVGHMNIGAGRVVYQDLAKINKAVRENTLGENKTLREAFAYARDEHKKLHLIGLVSDGGVHSHLDHLKELCTLASEAGLRDVYVHAFTDGRDTDPKGGAGYLEELQAHLRGTGGRIASVVGRYFAMDRDKRWERVRKAYDLLVRGRGEATDDPVQALRASYAADVTDEFIAPTVVVTEGGEPLAKIETGDVVLCFNFRTDRGREITQALTQRAFPEQEMAPLDLYYVTMTRYDDTFEGVRVMFEKENLTQTIGEVLSKAGKQQIRIAETEKYPHVTFFFSGGREAEFDGERRLMCPSPKVATYDLQPEMSAADIRDQIIPELEREAADFVCLNFANPDMVGHTGVFEAAVKACETVDRCAEAVCEVARKHGYAVLIIADHGNSDFMVNADGTPNTAHTTNLVPCILVDDDYDGALRDGVLGDVAPTLLAIMDVEAPAEMTGKSLLAPQPAEA
ncbi:MAG: 2,3-bisphosphoglycerate-independent phosphoglycerate mutase, partial [Catalinimonas sp.]